MAIMKCSKCKSGDWERKTNTIVCRGCGHIGKELNVLIIERQEKIKRILLIILLVIGFILIISFYTMAIIFTNYKDSDVYVDAPIQTETKDETCEEYINMGWRGGYWRTTTNCN